MSARFTKSSAKKAARWSAAPVAAALAVVLAAGPALAAGTSVGIATNGSASGGALTVGGNYQCATASGSYATLAVTVRQAGAHGRVVESSTLEHVSCTGAVLTWSATLRPSGHHAWFSGGNTRVEAKLWTPGDVRGQSDASLVLNASAS